MAPNASFEVAPSYAQYLNVVKRKEANELRKTMKPLLEKRRRARINDSLNHLKTLIIPLIGKDNTRYSKFEKADVLEMTVRFLRDLPNAPDKNPSDSFKDGYKACLQRVSALIPKTNFLDKATRQRVDEYIQQSISAVEAPVCRNCCAQNSHASSQVNHRVPVFECSEKSRSSGLRPNRAQSTVPPVISNMWRPW